MTTVLTVEPTAPGGWLAAVIPGRLAVVHRAGADDGFAARLWQALNDDDGIRLVIDELAKGGLTNAPGFVLAEWSGAGETVEARFIVRGGPGVTIETDRSGSVQQPDHITATGVSTWVERPVSGVTGFRVECGPSATAGGPSLPLGAGMAWVGALAFGTLASPHAEVVGDIAVAVAPAPAAPEVEASPRSADIDLDRTIADLEATVAGDGAFRAPAAEAEDRVPHEVDERQHETTGYDPQFGATMMRSVDEVPEQPPVDGPIETDEGRASVDSAAVSVPVAASVPAAPPLPVAPPFPSGGTPSLGDHDGLTVMSGDLRSLRETAAPSQVAPVTSAPAVPEEAGFVLRLPDGGSEPIDGMVVVGRAPSVSKMGGGRVPRLVTVDSVEHDISRNHVQLTVEGGTVVVTDLHSRNGTLISLPGKAPQKLRAGEPTSVIAGTVIDLGSGVTLGVAQA